VGEGGEFLTKEVKGEKRSTALLGWGKTVGRVREKKDSGRASLGEKQREMRELSRQRGQREKIYARNREWWKC